MLDKPACAKKLTACSRLILSPPELEDEELDEDELEDGAEDEELEEDELDAGCEDAELDFALDELLDLDESEDEVFEDDDFEEIALDEELEDDSELDDTAVALESDELATELAAEETVNPPPPAVPPAAPPPQAVKDKDASAIPIPVLVWLSACCAGASQSSTSFVCMAYLLNFGTVILIEKRTFRLMRV